MRSGEIVTLAALLLPVGAGASQTMSFNFDGDPVDKPPAGFTSYATGGGPPGKWVVKEMADARSGKHVVVQTDADATDTRFPILIADKGEYSDLDVSVPTGQWPFRRWVQSLIPTPADERRRHLSFTARGGSDTHARRTRPPASGQRLACGVEPGTQEAFRCAA